MMNGASWSGSVVGRARTATTQLRQAILAGRGVTLWRLPRRWTTGDKPLREVRDRVGRVARLAPVAHRHLENPKAGFPQPPQRSDDDGNFCLML